ncbi:uncharacterized protein [Temnothorax nylanderi]|uniref:uncharacterized protein n=1 Tax=Temnothorax nylanderi TaxID=102681 RepID=UPI003A8B9C94
MEMGRKRNRRSKGISVFGLRVLEERRTGSTGKGKDQEGGSGDGEGLGDREEKIWERLWLFDRLVWTVMGYGAEIWGWREREGMERLEERYIRWVLGVDGRTPWYLVREELQREKLRGRAEMSAWRFEKKLEEGKGSELARICWEELKGREKEGRVGSSWERERGGFFEDRGVGLEELERLREDGDEWHRKLFRGDKETQRKERWEKIEKSDYNRWYKVIKGEGIPGYLKKGWGESRWRRVARFRLGSEMRESRYWEGEEKKKCRMCEYREETWEHVWEKCRRWKAGGGSWQEAVGWVLNEEGGGEEWMMEIERERSEMEGKRMEGREEKKRRLERRREEGRSILWSEEDVSARKTEDKLPRDEDEDREEPRQEGGRQRDAEAQEAEEVKQRGKEEGGGIGKLE